MFGSRILEVRPSGDSGEVVVEENVASNPIGFELRPRVVEIDEEVLGCALQLALVELLDLLRR